MGANFTSVGSMLANEARSAMVDRLMDGRAMTAGELATASGVAASTASGHLAELTTGGLLRVVSAGRHRFYSLASSEVATALEALALICPAAPVTTMRRSTEARRMRVLRTCYDHLAGAVAVQLLVHLLEAPALTPDSAGFVVTPAGFVVFETLGVDVEAARERRRAFARPCLDWTERRPHLAGALGCALAASLIGRGWFERTSGARGLRVTAAGRAGLTELLGEDCAERALGQEVVVRAQSAVSTRSSR